MIAKTEDSFTLERDNQLFNIIYKEGETIIYDATNNIIHPENIELGAVLRGNVSIFKNNGFTEIIGGYFNISTL